MDELYNKIIERLNGELDVRELKQAQLVDLCKKADMPVSQPSISKILSGNVKPNLYQIAAFSKALDIPLDSLVWGEDKHRKDFCNPVDSEKLCASGQELEYYRGSFHFYFLSTASEEDKILHGKLDIDEKDGVYVLDMELDTGEVNAQKEPIIKRYGGNEVLTKIHQYYDQKKHHAADGGEEPCMILLDEGRRYVKKGDHIVLIHPNAIMDWHAGERRNTKIDAVLDTLISGIGI